MTTGSWQILAEFHWEAVLFSGGLFLAAFVLSIVFVVAVLVMLPETFLLDSHAQAMRRRMHPAAYGAWIVVKNLAGLALVVVGVLLSLPGIPGQGVLTILIGVMLMDFPGKRKIERNLLGRPGVLNTINRLRGRFGKNPLVSEEPAGGDKADEVASR